MEKLGVCGNNSGTDGGVLVRRIGGSFGVVPGGLNSDSVY